MARFFVDRPVFAWVIALVILLTGGLALKELPVAQYPEVAPPALAITATYPGASAAVVENSVVALIEQEMNGIDNLLYMDSSSEQNTATINLTFSTGTDIDIASVEAQNRIKRVESRLPDEVRRLGIQVTKTRRNFLLIVALYSPDKSYTNIDLASYAASNVLDEIRRVPGVGEATLFGAEYSMRIWVDPDKLAAYNMSPNDVIGAVQAQNTLLAVGEVNQPPAPSGMEYAATVITRGRLTTPEEFGAVIIRSQADGSVVRVRDVARVELGAQDYGFLSRYDGQPTAAIGIKAAPGSNAMDTAKAVKARMAELSKFFPEKSVNWAIPFDTTPFIKISIEEVLQTLVEAIILVFLVMYLFLENWRATLIPTIVVPISIIGAMLGLYVLGYSINVLTMFAMVLAIGIVVDDAIVVVENVERIMTEEDLSPRDATAKAMGQIMSAIVGVTVVLSAVFIPMAFFSGSVGAIYRQFAVTLVLTMMFSALMALTLTPALCATLLKHTPGQHDTLPSTGFFGWFNRNFTALTNRYVSRVRKILGRPGRWLAIYGVIFVVVGFLFAKLPGSFLPEEDQGYFMSMVLLPPGATQERTVEVIAQAEQYLKSQPEVDHVVAVQGFSFFGRGQNVGLMFVTLKDWSERKGDAHSVSGLLQRVNGALFMMKQAMIFSINPPSIPELAAVGGFDFRLQDRGGLGREQLAQAQALAMQYASENPNLTGVRMDGMPSGPQLLLEIDREKAQALGVDIANLNATLQTLFGTAYINDFERQGRILRVQMQADASVRTSPDAMLRVKVRNNSGGMVSLAEVVKPLWMVGAPRLDRYNGVPAIKLSGNPAPGHSTGDAMTAMTDVAAKLPPGIGYSWSGTSFEESLSGSQAPMLFAISLIVVFLCLAALYESWSIPFSVILVVPLGVLGALLAVLLRGMPNDVYFKVGLIATIGLSSKNAILIVEFARKLQDEGMALKEALLEACRLRLRPILMTSIAFIVGVLPLVISTGAGAQSRHAIGTGVTGGMLTATVLAIFFVPVFYLVVSRLFPGHGRGHHESKDNLPALHVQDVEPRHHD